MPETNYKNYVVRLIAFTALVRLLVAAALELGNDEVYYWTYSQQLEWNYFDHPPMVALWIRLFTGNLWLQNHELFIRLGSLVSCAVCTWLLYKIGVVLQSARAGWIAACLYNASPYGSVISGLFILPDSPQMVFWCGCLYLLIKILDNEKSGLYWSLFGLSAGLCIMSKVHGVFLWVGVLLFIIVQKRVWLKLPQLYGSLLLTAVVASPILLWNLQHHFVTYQYHSERVTVNRFAVNPTSFFRELLGQIAYNNPIVLGLSATAVAAWFRKKFFRTGAAALYLWIALPLIFLLLTIALFRDTLPHWSGPAYVALLPLTALYIDRRWPQRIVPKLVGWALGIILFVVVLGVSLIKYFPGTLGSKTASTLGKGDFTLDLYGWRNAGTQFAALYKADVQQGVVRNGTPVVCYKWFPAAHEEYYFCRPLGIALVGLGRPFDLHQYTWRNQHLSFDQAYCIVPSNEWYEVREKFAPYFKTIDSVTELKNYRSHQLARHFYVYRLNGFKKANGE